MAKEKEEEKDLLALALAKITKEYGKGAIMMGEKMPDIPKQSTGILSFDLALGGGFGIGKIVEVWGPPSSGKALSLDSKILTPKGWVLMKDVEEGLEVCTPDGGISTVIGVYPQGKKPMYKITFDDKTSVKACGEHLWYVNTRHAKHGEVLSTEELIAEGLTNADGRRKFRIPTTEPVHFDNGGIKLPVDPYILGLFLGDGTLSEKCIGFTTSDFELIVQIQEYFDKRYGDVLIKKVSENSDYDFRITKKKSGSEKDAFRQDLIKLGVTGTHSYSKFIPEIYKFSSVEDRIALLQGLLDSDGSSDPYGASYTTTSYQLSQDFVFIARSLGLRCSTASRTTKYKNGAGVQVDGRESYRTNILRTKTDFDLFRLKKHLSKRINQPSSYSNRFIESIEKIGELECQCIAVGHPDKLFITDDFIVTHNTTVSIHAMVQAQIDQPDKVIAIIDAEHALDSNYCKALGLDMSKILICQPDNGEQGTQIALELIETGRISFLLVDSIAALTPKVIIDGEMEQNTMGAHARMMSKFLSKAASLANKTGTTIYMTNQTRNKIGTYGNPEITTGGESPKFYASQRIELKAKLGEKDEDKNLTHKVVTATVAKNKIAPPFKSCEMRIGFGVGVDKVFDTFEIALKFGFIKVTGRTYSYGEVKLGTSREDAYKLYCDNIEIQEEIYSRAIDTLKNGTEQQSTPESF